MTRPVLPLVPALLALLLLPSQRIRAEEDARPWAARPFLGLSVRDTEHGTVVSWIHPGPLGGRGFESTSGIRRGDNVDALDGQAVDAAAFKAAVEAHAPGDEVVLVVRRSPDAAPDAAVPRGGEGGEARTVTVRLGSRARWAGTLGQGLGGRAVPAAAEGELEALILQAAGEVGVRGGNEDAGGGLDVLLPYLAKVQDEALDPNALACVVQALRRPLSIDAVEAGVFAALAPTADGQTTSIEGAVRRLLDLRDPTDTIAEILGHPAEALTPAEVRSVIRFAGQHLEQAQGPDGWRAAIEGLVAALRTSVYVFDDPGVDEHVRTIGEIAGPRVGQVLDLALVLLRLAPAAWIAEAEPHATDAPLAELPEAVRAAVEGDVLWWGQDPLGHLAVVGGPGPNRYDLRRVAAVYDVGGDDRYDHGRAETPLALRLVIDLAGNDVHASETDFEGPGTAVLGLSVVDDRSGDDVYRTSHAFAVGAGALGIGLLVDHAGDDLYEAWGEASGWGLGAGFYGVGLVVDRAGSDVYRGETRVEGVGGPRGLGAVVDAAGADLYVADGPHVGSAYGTPAVYLGMSQGFGMGIRGYAAGGLGALVDLGGDDRYEAGEFSQAGGYFFGLGVLHDVAGNDLYAGNRYGQAFAAHQAAGVLVDDAGDDTYWSMTAASQGGTWDQSVGLLLDRGGNDAYRCDGLGQGSAAMQAVGLLVDLGGDDRYTGRGASVQGAGGGNEYHHDADHVFSFSALLDLGGGRDVYSSGRPNDATQATGAWRPERPGGSTLYGLFMDR